MRGLRLRSDAPFFTIIVPVYNGAATLERCLLSIHKSEFTDWELIVVDDGSVDDSAEIAQKFTFNVLHTPIRSGPAAARNLAAQHARGRYLLFTDADCELHIRTLSQFASILRKYSNSQCTVNAVIGSYDDEPAAANFVSQYKNLLHHFTHQIASENAQTFWTGCGAIERECFLQLGGFDASRYPHSSIEDIELGYRLNAVGGSIRLLKTAQVKHLKHWSLWKMLYSDVADRALPWSELLLSQPLRHYDLNVSTSQRLSVVLTLLLPILTLIRRQLSILLLAMLGVLNWRFYRFLFAQRGLLFTLCALPIHLLSFAYSGIAFGLVWLRCIYSMSNS